MGLIDEYQAVGSGQGSVDRTHGARGAEPSEQQPGAVHRDCRHDHRRLSGVGGPTKRQSATHRNHVQRLSSWQAGKAAVERAMDSRAVAMQPLAVLRASEACQTRSHPSEHLLIPRGSLDLSRPAEHLAELLRVSARFVY